MNDPRWTTVDGLFEAALERDPKERAAFVREACAGDETLRREVESLLAHDQRAGDFLDGPAVELVGGHPTETHPSLIGRQIGAHRIVALLGVGGMGEVYRAHDTALGRDVAIKLLPQAFTTDPERRARFDREARLLASLNHPHIGAIYGVEEIDPSSGAGPTAWRALVLELVEGETLADRLARGPIPPGEALPLAVQIADALEAAHDKGIVHRDLKPANIKITPQGVVKVLDFGLAKATSGEGAGPDLSQVPTVATSGTGEGVILGTAAYMSPEQARGKPVDKRTDIWAFGCVLYEMLTGRIAFAGETLSDTLAVILEREPDWKALPSPAPDKVRDLLRRCLQKDPRRRLHDIADARMEIEDALSGAPGKLAETAGVHPLKRPGRPPWSIAVAASVGTLVIVGTLAWVVQRSPPGRTAPPRISRTTIAASGPARVVRNGFRSLAITSDGRRVVYVGDNRQLFVRRLDQLDSTALATAITPLNYVFISPDDQWVGFDAGGTLMKVALSGGVAMPIVNTGSTLSSATWAPDDTLIFATFEETTGLRRVPAGGGEVTVLTQPDKASGERDHLWPEMLPGGRGVLFTITATTGGPDTAQIAVLDLSTRAIKRLMLSGSHAHYVATGHLLFTAGGTLRTVPFDLARLETRGTPVAVLPRLVRGTLGAGDFIAAADGTLAYVDAPDVAANTLVWVDRQGREEPLGVMPGNYAHPRVSPDGTRVTAAVGPGGSGIWVWDLARRSAGRLTLLTPDSAYHTPLWTTDGRRVLFFALTLDAGLFSLSSDGTGKAERVGTGLPWGVTPDGTKVLFSPPGPQADLLMLTLDTRRVEPLVQTPSNERNGVVSPDGRWLAYESDRTGRFEIHVRPFPNVSAGEWIVDSGTRPHWAPKGALNPELFYVAPDGAIMAVRVNTRASVWSAGSPEKVVEERYVTGGALSARSYDVSPDGQRFLVIKPPAGASSPQIVVVQNWTEELKRLAPSPLR